MSEFEIDLPPYKDEPGPHYYNRDEPVSTNYLNIELSKDLNVEALTEEIKKGMDRAAAQLKEAYRSKIGFWEISKDTLMPDVVTQEWVMQHGEFHEAEPEKYLYQAPKPITMDEQRVRSMIREEVSPLIRELVHRELYLDAALANPHKHMRVEMTTERGEKWRGVLYGVEEGK